MTITRLKQRSAKETCRKKQELSAVISVLHMETRRKMPLSYQDAGMGLEIRMGHVTYQN